MSSLYLILSVAMLATLSSGALILPEGKLSGAERMDDPKYKECLGRCPVTLDFGPICASDGKSYPNTSSMECLANCVKPLGEDLKMVSGGFCPSDLTSVKS